MKPIPRRCAPQASRLARRPAFARRATVRRDCCSSGLSPLKKGASRAPDGLGVSPDTDSPCGLSVPGERHRPLAGGLARRLLARLWAFLPFHATRVARSAVEN